MVGLSILPWKCLVPLFCFLLTVIFLAEFRLIWGEEAALGLWIVRGQSSRDFFFRRISKSLLTKFVGEITGEFGGVTEMHGSIPLVFGGVPTKLSPFPFENGGVPSEHNFFPFERILDFRGEGEDDGMYVMWDEDGMFAIGWGIGDG